MFEQNRPRTWNPQRERSEAQLALDAAATLTKLRTENDRLCAELRVLQAENLQLHEMVAEQARTITAVQQLVGAPAPASINATIDVKLGIDQQLTPAMQKEIEAFVARLQHLDHATA